MKLKLFPDSRTSAAAGSAGELAELRIEMVEKQLRRRGIADPRLLSAMATVSRQDFVPNELRHRAYEDGPLPIGAGQTISQPYIVAAMTAALRLSGEERVLDIGTGCGYQAAILSRLASEVFTMERHSELACTAAGRLERLGFGNVHVHCGDGTLGLPECAPFDAILVAAAAPEVPGPLRAQLRDGGRLIVPVGNFEDQELQLVQRQGDTFCTSILEGCRFVPLVGYHGWKEFPPQ
jgi:protein-L-isoaspartate(D-aspartate) O-methyltransferase